VDEHATSQIPKNLAGCRLAGPRLYFGTWPCTTSRLIPIQLVRIGVSGSWPAPKRQRLYIQPPTQPVDKPARRLFSDNGFACAKGAERERSRLRVRRFEAFLPRAVFKVQRRVRNAGFRLPDSRPRLRCLIPMVNRLSNAWIRAFRAMEMETLRALDPSGQVEPSLPRPLRRRSRLPA
jgi:hypothetical protein